MVRRIVHAVPGLLALLAAAVGLTGCGWLQAGDVSHVKPSGFVLRGYVSVAGAPTGRPGTSCQVPATGITANAPVRVTDAADRSLGAGVLGAGVLAADGAAYRCNFPFEITGVAGGHDRYAISAAGRPAVLFPATELRQDKPAVIRVD
jgi:hypothetical protein